MRKLKLQMQVTVDGFVAGPEGELDWMSRDLDAALLARIMQLTDTSDTILLGRKMTEGFVKYWEQAVTQKDNPELELARRMVDYSKVVFSKTLQRIDGKNVRVENGDLVRAVDQLKSKPGKDIVVYGGANLVSSLLEHGLIDELNLFVNPIAIGRGMQIFKGRKPLKLATSTVYTCGTVVNTYVAK
jgi:dihydrofolate reductase